MMDISDTLHRLLYQAANNTASQKLLPLPDGHHMLYKSHISLVYGNTTANAKSVLSVLGAGVRAGDEIVIQCEGEDEQEALEAMVKTFESGLE